MQHNAPDEPIEQKQPAPRDRSGLLAWIALGVVALLFLTYLKWRPLPIDGQGVHHPAVGQQVIFHKLEPLTGGSEPFTGAELRGNVTLVNLWGTWCGPCEEEFPYLVAIYEQFKSHHDFRYLSVSYPGEPQSLVELREATAEFLLRQRANHATYYDPDGQMARAIRSIGMREGVFPTTLVIDPQGVIKGVWQGYNRASMVEIERLLEGLL